MNQDVLLKKMHKDPTVEFSFTKVTFWVISQAQTQILIKLHLQNYSLNTVWTIAWNTGNWRIWSGALMGGEFGSGQIPHHPPQETPYRKLVFHNELARMICCNLTWMRLSPVLKGFPQLVPAGLHSEIFGTCFWRLFVSEMLAYPVIKWENDFSCTSSAAMCGEEACGQEWLSLMGKAPRGTPVVLGSQQAEGKCGLSIQEAWAGKRVWYLLQSSTTAGMYLWKTCCTVWERLSEAATEDGSEAAGCNWQGCAFSKHHCRHELREAPIS